MKEMSSYSIRNILVPVDLSDTSLNAIETAVALAKKHHATLHLFHVVEIQPGYNEVVLGTYSTTNINTDVLYAIASAIKHQHELVPNIIEIEGNVADCIVNASLQLPADLIVMGTHGASGYREGFIGSNTYSTVKYSTCPVLTVPPVRKITTFRKVLFPIRPVTGALSDYGVTDNFFAAKTTVDVLGFAYRGDSETSVLEKLVSEAKQNGRWVDVKTNALWGVFQNIPEAVLQHAQNEKTDLVILTSLLDSVAKPAYIGPHAQKIIQAAKVPVLNVKKTGVPTMALFVH